MAITPIDVQVNMGHVLDVARNMQSRNEALIQQQLLMDKESEVESNKQKDTIQQNKETDETRLNTDARGQQGGQKRKRREASDDDSGDRVHGESYDDPNLGTRIDYTR
ncbi:MAG: hypothetical protein ACOC2H_01590 [Spirochaetota bacterium]